MAGKQPATTAPAGRRRAAGQKSPQRQRASEIIGELRRVRALLREVGDAYILRREALVADLIRKLQEDSAANKSRRRFSVLEKQLRAFRNEKLKPSKGRRKDLSRIEDLLERLAASLDG